MSTTRSPIGARTFAAATLSLGVLASASGAVAASSHANTRIQAASVTMRATVVSDNLARHTLVVALHSGVVRTLRFSTARRVAVGAQISATASKLGDGTYRTSILHVHAKAHSVQVRGTVVGIHGRRLELSSGGSVFTVLRPRLSSHDANSNPSIGEVVDVSVDVQSGSLDETSVQNEGMNSMIDLEGTLAAISSTSLTINVNEGATTVVAIPTSITLPSTIAAGDQVELLVAYANPTFTLVTITDDQSAANNASNGVSQSDQNQNSNIEIEGLVTTATTASSTSLSVQPGDNAAQVVVAIPSTMTTVPTLMVGDSVHVVADMVNGTLTLVSLDVQGPQDSQGSQGDQGQSVTTQAEGQVVAVTATSLVIQPNDQLTPVTFVVPTSVDVSSISTGDQVDASGVISGSVLTLTEFEIQN